jgi:hypothetical protein
MGTSSAARNRLDRKRATTPETLTALVGRMAAPVPPRQAQDRAETESRAVPGPLLFARYAYPPNSLGYCGPRDSASLLGYGSERVVDGGLRQLARGFEGAYPYLELIACATGVPDPLDHRVVEAYWLGNEPQDVSHVRSQA